jgi:diguanylate cyclase (GGDEF)-like protein
VSVVLVLGLGVAAAWLYLPSAMRAAATDAAHRSNLEIADQIKITRGYYTQNVFAKVTGSGAFSGSFTHETDPKAIPLPATFVKDISDLLKAKDTTLSLVSPYPWPHRADRKMDEFETAAWEAFQKDPDVVFSRQEVKDGRRVLRVAVADRMASATCVSCHNTHPESAKRDWKVGDVRAVMQVTKVVEPYLATAEQRARMILWTLAGTAALATLALLIGALLVDRRTREKRRADHRLHHLAHHDALTGLANRVLLWARLEQALAQRQELEHVLVFCLDLDRFKDINDALGHSTGDELLKAVAERVRNCIQETDTLARLGGDEFVIVRTTKAYPFEGADLAKAINGALQTPFDLNGHSLIVQASIGISSCPTDACEADKLLKFADLAAYSSKSAGRGSFRFFKVEMDERLEARQKLEADLRSAIENNELELFYQPLQSLVTNDITGFEALLRWRHPERGLVSPADFIPVAEETLLIVSIGEWAIREACIEAAKWPDHLSLSLNLSAVQFKSPRLVQVILIALASTGLRPNRLELEITESVMMQDEPAAVAILNQLRTFGMRVALDDFGTGFSSLSYLHRYPFDRLKIDRSFVSSITDKGNALAIVRASANLGSSLGMAITAEGVETQEQLDQVRAAGCTEMQGYLLSPPVAVRELAQFLTPHTPPKAAEVA